ncbi:MAG: hypothetical protein M3Q95_07755 [Bacteroidota bacterium]|nr:hypothetical protein [Bacteroidota bacterium]
MEKLRYNSFKETSKNATEVKINRIEESKPDVVLMEIEMPGMSGVCSGAY